MDKAKTLKKSALENQNEIRQQLQRELELVNTKLGNLLDLRLEQEIDKETYTSRKKLLLLEQKKLKAKIAENSTDVESTFERVKSWVKHAQSLENIGRSDDKHLKRVAFANLSDSNAQVGSARVWLGGLENEAESAAEPPETCRNSGKNEKMKNVASDSVPWATLLKAVAVRETTTEKRLPVRHRYCGWNLFQAQHLVPRTYRIYSELLLLQH